MKCITTCISRVPDVGKESMDNRVVVHLWDHKTKTTDVGSNSDTQLQC
jgi:hypothetical protein